jgi:hypothetical protein
MTTALDPNYADIVTGAPPEFWEQLPHGPTPRHRRHGKMAAPLSALTDPDSFVRGSALTQAVIFGGLSFLFTSFMCGIGAIPGAIWGHHFGIRVGNHMVENLWDKLHEERAKFLALEEKDRKRADQALVQAQRERARAEREAVKAAKQAERDRVAAEKLDTEDPLFHGLLGLGYTREECLPAVRATKSVPDMGARLRGALNLLGKKTA